MLKWSGDCILRDAEKDEIVHYQKSLYTKLRKDIFATSSVLMYLSLYIIGFSALQLSQALVPNRLVFVIAAMTLLGELAMIWIVASRVSILRNLVKGNFKICPCSIIIGACPEFEVEACAEGDFCVVAINNRQFIVRR